MLFDYDLTVPAGTLKSAPAVAQVKLTRGTLTEIRVYFPPGPATLVHVQVLRALHTLMPANPDGELNFDDLMITSRLEYNLSGRPYEVTLRGWAPLAIFEHTITFQFEVMPIKKETWQTFLADLFKQFPPPIT